jgi:outer membrane protein assembly factor BamB
MRAAPCPVFNLFAAHDGQEEQRAQKPIAQGWTRNYESILGPTYYSFDWGGRHFVVFANEDHMFAPPEAQAKARWLGNDLKTHKGRPTVLFVHVPPSQDFLDTVANTDVASVFFGHWHSSKAYSYRGIQVFATPPLSYGGIDKSPRGYRRVRIRQGRLTTELLPIRSRRSSPALQAPRRRFGAVKKPPLRLLWSRHLDTKLHRAAPVVCNEKILLALSDEDGKGRQGVLCLSLETGQLCWRRRTDTSVKNAVAISISSQTLTENSGDLAVAVSVTGRLSAFDIRSGQTLWTTDLPGYPDRWVYTSAVVTDNVVYTGAKAGYGACNLADGEPLWYYEPSSLRTLQRRVGLLDGKPLWYYEPTDSRSDYLPCYASPIVIQDTIVLFVQRTGMIGLERASGRERWRREMDVEYMYPQPVAVDGGVLSGGDRGERVKLDPKTGQLLWRRRITEDKHLSGLGANRNDIFVITPSGDCRAY